MPRTGCEQIRYKVGVSAETFRAIPNRLRREPADEIEPSLHPAGERVISRIAVWLDADKARQGPADEPHRSHVRLAECLLAAFRAHPDHERRIGDATEHTEPFSSSDFAGQWSRAQKFR